MDARLILALALTATFLAGLLLSPFILMWLSKRNAKRASHEWERMSGKDFGDAPKVPRGFRDTTITDFPLHSQDDTR